MGTALTHSRTHALAAIVILTLNVLASTSFAQHPALSRLDLDGDGVADRVYTYPDGFPNPAPGQSPGEVHEVSGATNDTLVRFIGETPGDRFGFSVAYAGDRQRDGNVDLLIGAPSVNAVYVFDGPFKFMCPVPVELVSADKASMKVIRRNRVVKSKFCSAIKIQVWHCRMRSSWLQAAVEACRQSRFAAKVARPTQVYVMTTQVVRLYLSVWVANGELRSSFAKRQLTNVSLTHMN